MLSTCRLLDCWQVKTLNLSRNQLNCVPKLFSRFTNLESLNLSNNLINLVPGVLLNPCKNAPADSPG